MRRLFPVILIAAALLPAHAVAQKVRVDYEHQNDFTKYKTYKWVKMKESPDVNQIVDQRITAALDAEMTKEGLTKSESNPDLFIGYQAVLTQQQQLTTFTNGGGPAWGYGGGWGYGWGASSISTTTSSTVNNGTLVVDLMDPQQQKLVFRGIATDTLSDKPEKNAKKIQKAVTKIFEKYPPKDKK
jgi:Domain of unknown function (DUF4136)